VLNSKDNLISSYDFYLPKELIAQVPVNPRHAARLLILDKNKEGFLFTRHMKIWDLINELRPKDLLIVNNTKVIKARLIAKREGGGKSEIFILEPKDRNSWLCLGRPAKRMHSGDIIYLEAKNKPLIRLEVISKDEISGTIVINFPEVYDSREKIFNLVNDYGEVPLPPYINNKGSFSFDDYQTRYAKSPGAVAAPTAGLHLSDELISAIKLKGIQIVEVTLHIGLGTFKPIGEEDLTNLKLHSEWVEVNKEVVSEVNKCKQKGGKVIAVGTTSLRAIEGVCQKHNGVLQEFRGKVDIVIKPGYRLNVIDGILTNFHLPKSSLLLLVSALIGREKLLALYLDAIKRQYRFFSYGDAMLIQPKAVLNKARPID
tara:strand:- start:414 stop:1529 length:1116 start_codon:yes stop_codon:yes gene_type:complete